jgi:hypothetical protein
MKNNSNNKRKINDGYQPLLEKGYRPTESNLDRDNPPGSSPSSQNTNQNSDSSQSPSSTKK